MTHPTPCDTLARSASGKRITPLPAIPIGFSPPGPPALEARLWSRANVMSIIRDTGGSTQERTVLRVVPTA